MLSFSVVDTALDIWQHFVNSVKSHLPWIMIGNKKSWFFSHFIFIEIELLSLVSLRGFFILSQHDLIWL